MCPCVRACVRPSTYTSIRPHVQVHASQSIHVHVRFSRTLGNIFRSFYGHDDLTQCCYISVHPPVCPSVRPSVCLSIRPSVRPSTVARKPGHTCTCKIFSSSRKYFSEFFYGHDLTQCRYMSVHPPVRPSVCPAVRPSTGAREPDHTCTCKIFSNSRKYFSE